MTKSDEPDPVDPREDGLDDGLAEGQGDRHSEVLDTDAPGETAGADPGAEDVNARGDAAEDAPGDGGAAEHTPEPVQEELIPQAVDPGAIEAILLVVDEPINAVTLASVLDRPEHLVVEALRGLAMAYDAEQRGFDLREVAGGWRLYTRERYADLVERFVLDGQQAKLTQASLETLAVVAYRQPVSRSRVSAIRGVNCDGVMRTLVSRGLVEEAGTDRESGAILYRTTSYFLERLGLNSLDELPDLAPYLPDLDEVEDALGAERTAPGPATPDVVEPEKLEAEDQS